MTARRLPVTLRTRAVVLHFDLTSLSKLDGLVSPLQLCTFQRKLFGMLEGAAGLFSAQRLFHSGQVSQPGPWGEVLGY